MDNLIFMSLKDNQDIQNVQIEVHKCFDSYLGKINIVKSKDTPNATTSSLSNTPKLVIILDISGSMGSQVTRFVQKIIPQVVKTIYGSSISNTVTLITFESQDCVGVYESDFVDISQLRNIEASGCTYMAQAVDKF